ncbi:hypothetical protein BWGOE4_23240 [Bacillus mycoides]|uniref:Glycosyltransferase 2-like domain-containing protein n=2 Tax=Bacillus TaxID=1386 RepID=A0A1D3MI53_BACMY|nr:glycosyltransferase [Bacillus mycoides]MBJ8072622.1 hypothetical protein [Bacillus cereus]MBJ8187921.1 hypothetical protein [Bacillus cereus]OFD44975.1 hypothetical protein BWGOE2_22360 [Bacillus mycoides]OFD47812.1 hypothetical protein BWGOE1_22920 [Bacillus mycoides]OFD49874.1 hypothetical protein BWGOE3_22320 [Bacillus mycoides]
MFECKNQLSRSNIENLKNNSNIPVIVIAFNNITYLKKMLNQLQEKKVEDENIWIWDNNSTFPPLLKFYEQISTKYNLMKNNENYGPQFFTNPQVLNLLPDFFAVSDPDLYFNEQMPDDFLGYLKKLTIDLSVFKAGLALDISPDPNFNEELRAGFQCTVRQWEQQFWLFPLRQYNNPKVYKAHIDTTFAVYNKKFINNGFYDAVRVADDFTCKHLPWYKNNIISDEEKKLFNTEWSNWN